MSRADGVLGARMSTLGPLLCLALSYRVESWDKYILWNVENVTVGLLFSSPRLEICHL